jgi:hypothetical protein
VEVGCPDLTRNVQAIAYGKKERGSPNWFLVSLLLHEPGEIKRSKSKREFQCKVCSSKLSSLIGLYVFDKLLVT